MLILIIGFARDFFVFYLPCVLIHSLHPAKKLLRRPILFELKRNGGIYVKEYFSFHAFMFE